jgi:hypothetical protein
MQAIADAVKPVEAREVIRLAPVVDPDCFNPAFNADEPPTREDLEDLGTADADALAGFSARADFQKADDLMGLWD